MTGPFRRTSASWKCPAQAGCLPEQSAVESRSFRAAFHAAVLRPGLSADLGRPGCRHGGHAARRRPSRRHHRLGRLQCARLSHALAGLDRCRRSQRRTYRAEPAEARRCAASAVAGRSRSASSAQAGNRHNSAAYDRFIAPHLDPTSRRYWEKPQLARAAPHRRVRAQLLPHWPARPVHRRRPSRRRGSTASIRASSCRRTNLARAAPLLRRAARAGLRQARSCAGLPRKVLAVRPRHPAGAI